MGCDISMYVEIQKDNKWHLVDQIEIKRNYALFAMLADVRGIGYNPISEPRGVPEDASEEYLQIVKEQEGNAYFHSYHTFNSLNSYDWDQVRTEEGIVAYETYLALKGKGVPESWCSSVSGSHVRLISSAEEKEFVLKGEIKPTSTQRIYVEHSWEIPYRELAQSFIDQVMSYLNSLGDAHKVRIVFFFDNP